MAMRLLGVVLSVTLLLAGVAHSQEVEPETVTVRVSNPFDRYATLFIECGPYAKSSGLVMPESVTTIALPVADLCEGTERALLTVAFEGGGAISFDQNALKLEGRDMPIRGALLCLGLPRSTAWAIPDSMGVRVPMACPRNGGTSG